MAACEPLIVFLLSPLLTTVVTGTTTYRLNWTREGVRPYHIDNPLVVKLGDIVALDCVNSSFRSVWLLTEASEYENCSCSASCAVQRQRVTENCIPVLREVLLQINENALDLGRVFNYRPGKTYYVASFEVGEMGGGACLPTDSEPGVRMALMVSTSRAETETSGSTTINNSDNSSTPTPKSLGIGNKVEGMADEDTNFPIIPIAASAAGAVFLIILCAIIIIIITGIACLSRRSSKKKDVYLTSAGNSTLNSDALYTIKPATQYSSPDDKEEEEEEKKDFAAYSIESFSTFKEKSLPHQEVVDKEGEGDVKSMNDNKNKFQDLSSLLYPSGTISKPIGAPVEVSLPLFTTVAPKTSAEISSAIPTKESSAMDPPNLPAKEPKPSVPPKESKPSLPPHLPAKEPKPSVLPKESTPSLPPNVPPKEHKPSLPPKESKPLLPPNLPAKEHKPSVSPIFPAKKPKPSLPPKLLKSPNLPAKMSKPSVTPNVPVKATNALLRSVLSKESEVSSSHPNLCPSNHATAAPPRIHSKPISTSVGSIY